MTTFDLIEVFNRYSAIQRKRLYLFGLIRSWASQIRAIDESWIQTLNFDEHQLVSNFRLAATQLKKARVDIMGAQPAQVILEAHNLGVDLEALANSVAPCDQRPFALLAGLVKQLSNVYEVLLKSHSDRDALLLLRVANNLEKAVLEIERSGEFIRSHFAIGEPPDGLRNMLLEFAADDNPRTITERLASLNKLYEELCGLLEASLQRYPLRIIRLEVGSLFTVTQGFDKAIDLLGDLIKSALNYFYRNYTNEGKITLIPRKVEVIESALHLRDALAERGVSVERLDSKLQQASIIIADELNDLLGAVSRANVNGQIFEAPKELQELITARSKPLLEFNATEANGGADPREEDDEPNRDDR